MTAQQLSRPDTPTYKLVAEKLGRDPLDLIHERRNKGLSYPQIAQEIREATQVNLSHELMRRWYFFSIGQPIQRHRRAA